MKAFNLLLLILFTLIITFLSKYLLLSDDLFYSSYSEQFARSQIELILSQSKEWEWLGYVLIPIICVFKCLLTSLCLSLGIFLITNKFDFRIIFRVSVLAEFVFLLPAIIKILWFLFIQTTYTLQDLQLFYPLSALNIFDPKLLEPWLLYPLQVFNVFEVIYWVVLAYLLSKELPDMDMNSSFGLVMSSYGSGLVIWIALVMFLTITYT